MNKENPIIVLVNKGLKLEKVGENNHAQDLFIQAWNESSNDWERCVAAHFVARHQTIKEDALKWNLESLAHANKVGNDTVKTYYPSLYLAVGSSYESLGNFSEAKKYYDLAFEKISDLPTDENNKKYSKGVRDTIMYRMAKLEEKMK